MSEDAHDSNPKPYKSIELLQRLECLKTNWYVWSCTITKHDGTEVIGTIQADYSGDLKAYETVEME